MTKAGKLALLGGLAIGALILTSKPAQAAVNTLTMGKDKYDSQLKAAAEKYGLSDWLILKAIMGNESDYGRDPTVIAGISDPENADASASEDGLSWGLFQETLSTARWLRPGTTVADLNNPAISIDLAAKYVAYLLKRENGDLEKAVEAYNEGPGNVDKGRKDPDYWNKFSQHYSELQTTA